MTEQVAMTDAFRRIYIKVAIVVGVIALLAKGEWFAPFILSALSLYFSISLLRRCVELWPQVSSLTKRKIWRMVIAVRRFYKVPKEVEFLYLITWLFTIIALTILVIVRPAFDIDWFWQIVAALMFISASVDAKQRIEFVIRRVGASKIGMIALAGIGAVIFYLAMASAKEFAHSVTGINPSAFSEFVGVTATLVTPILYFAILIFAAYLWAIAEFFGWLIIPIGATIVRLILQGPFTREDLYQRVMYRLVTGKRLDIAVGGEGIEWRWMVAGMRTFATLMLMVALGTELGVVSGRYNNDIERQLTRLLIFLEYRENSSCSNLRHSERVSYLEGGEYVSVVTSDNTKPHFKVLKCERGGSKQDTHSGGSKQDTHS